jgi:hypothetical protein
MATLQKMKSHILKDPNRMPFDAKKTNPLVEVEGAGMVSVTETTDVSLDMLHPVPGQTHNLPPSHEVVQHEDEIAAARDVGSTALHNVERESLA